MTIQNKLVANADLFTPETVWLIKMYLFEIFHYYCHYPFLTKDVFAGINCMGFEILSLTSIHLYSSYFAYVSLYSIDVYELK